MLDEPERPLRHRPPERLHPRPDVILGVDRLADVVQQGRQQELLVIRPGVARQLEDLQAVIERIPLRVIPGVLLHRLQRFQPHLVDREPVEVIGHRGDARPARPRVDLRRRPIRPGRPRPSIPSRGTRAARGPRRRKAGPPAGRGVPGRPPPSASPRRGHWRRPRPANPGPPRNPWARSTDRAGARPPGRSGRGADWSPWAPDSLCDT